MKTSLSSFVYYNYSLPHAIEQISNLGYQGIDIWGGRPHAYRKDLDEQDCLQLRQVLASSRLEVASFIPAQFRYPTCLCSPIQKIQEDSVSYIQDSTLTAARLGASVVSVCPGHTLKGQGKSAGWETLKASMRSICRFAKIWNLRIAIEPADCYETDLVNTIADAAKLIAEVGESNLGVLIDSGHVHVSSESMPEAFQAAGDRLYHIHIDDNLGKRDQHLVPGLGSINFTEFFSLVRAHAYQGFVCAELSWDYTLNPDDAARNTLEYLRTW